MGMYTEIFFRATLVKDVPEQVISVLSAMVDARNPIPEVLPDHPLFKCSRWVSVGCGGSAYFPTTNSGLTLDGYNSQWTVQFLANLKNYSGEIRHFFDWIDPYVHGPEGQFLGYSLYEEFEDPILYHKVSEANYFRYDKDIYNMWKTRSTK